MKNVQLKKGFTLIELLIVIAIIAVLAVAFLPSLMGAPSKSRDTQRITSITKLSNFLMTQTLSNKALPASGCIDSAGDVGSIGELIKNNLPEFGGTFPVDPKTGNVTTNAGAANCTSQYGYIKFDTGKGYNAAVYAAVENPESANIICKDLKANVTPSLKPGGFIATGQVEAGKVAIPQGEVGCYAGLVQ